MPSSAVQVGESMNWHSGEMHNSFNILEMPYGIAGQSIQFS
jgi:hypothetical protein